MNKILKVNILISLIFFILIFFLFYNFIDLIKKHSETPIKNYEISNTYYLPAFDTDRTYIKSLYNSVKLENLNDLSYLNPYVYHDVFYQTATSLLNIDEINKTINKINSKLSLKDQIDNANDVLFLKENSYTNYMGKGESISIVIKSDKKNFDNFLKELESYLFLETNKVYINILSNKIENSKNLIDVFEEQIEAKLNQYLIYLKNIELKDFENVNFILYDIFKEGSFSKSHLDEAKSTFDKNIDFNFDMNKKELIIFLNYIITNKNYKLISKDYFLTSAYFSLLKRTQKKYTKLINDKNLLNVNLSNLIINKKYLISKNNKFLGLSLLQNLFMTFIFSSLITFMLFNLINNWKKYWKILKNL